MKIIMLSPFAPYPPDSGGRIRQWELIKFLGRRHELTLAFFINPGEEKILNGVFEGICSKVTTITHSGNKITENLHSLPWPMRAYGVDSMQKLLTELSSNCYDLLITEFIYMAQHRSIFKAPAVLHEHNIESSIFRQYSELPDIKDVEIYGIRKEALFWKATWMHMRQYENKTWPEFDLRITVSKLDQDEMDQRCPDGRTVVAENGVNTNEIRLLPVNRSKKILLVGTMNYFPNIDGALYMVQTIMPYIWHLDPSIGLCIAGKNIPRIVRDISIDNRIEIVTDPPDIKTVAADCSVSVVPLRIGGGTRIKIIEAFALGLTVVSTAKGCEGLAVEDGRHLMIRDDPESFAEAVTMAVSDHEFSDSLRRNGRMLVEARYDWQKIFKEAEEKILNII